MDGQGGGIGATLIKYIRDLLGNDLEIWALGTNAVATSRMMKAGANRGASGENSIVKTCPLADVIVGPLGIIMADAMMGEVTSATAAAVSASSAEKILIPLTKEPVHVAGVSGEPLPHLVTKAVERIREVMTRV
jgi:hypothetical protein